ncbi:unnamed protein product [Leptidea sinapis]|uniref:Uncharacterized protein n=1 Tax=Leptidea sinapis TaxID=189913 RepID=A0A5E4PQ18_9NEOP|nr:unnamed protein product [Leptidea sinapis]
MFLCLMFIFITSCIVIERSIRRLFDFEEEVARNLILYKYTISSGIVLQALICFLMNLAVIQKQAGLNASQIHLMKRNHQEPIPQI